MNDIHLSSKSLLSAVFYWQCSLRLACNINSEKQTPLKINPNKMPHFSQKYPGKEEYKFSIFSFEMMSKIIKELDF